MPVHANAIEERAPTQVQVGFICFVHREDLEERAGADVDATPEGPRDGSTDVPIEGDSFVADEIEAAELGAAT